VQSVSYDILVYLADTDSWSHHSQVVSLTNPRTNLKLGTGYLYTNSNFGLQIFQSQKVAMFIDLDTLFETGKATLIDIEGMLTMNVDYIANHVVRIFTYVKP
jgi:hypothetical protein